jgi:hypothetical protein
VLGTPEKITVAQTQPDLILGLPPMHVDYIAPPGEGLPRVTNVSVFPDSFNVGYAFEGSSSSSSSRQHTSSYTYSTKETVKDKIVFGSPKADSVSVKFKFAATQEHESVVSKTHDTYSSRTDSFDTATEFDDLIAASSLRMNIYSYPVIGQYVCPADNPDCSEDEKVPLQVQYSAPDNIVYTLPTSAAAFEWFQPVTEPGNIFSYPGSLALLEAAETRQDPQAQTSSTPLDFLTPADALWESQSTQAVTIGWSAGQGTEKSSGSSETLSYDTSLTVAETAKGVGVSGKDSQSIEYNDSSSNSTLNTSTTALDASLGATLKRGLGAGGSADDASLLYEGQTYIYGMPKPDGSIQSDLPVPADVTTYGRIEVAHAADMLSSGFIQSGDWWKQAYTVAPDVALNHPQRWLQKLPTSSNNQEVLFNCPVGFTSDFGTPSADPGSCQASGTQPDPVNVSDAAFYRMKGLFVLPGDSTTGPTTTTATLGDTVTLEARVYNYSLANMPSGTTVHVRFYAQPWDSTAGQFATGAAAYGFAPAQYVGEALLPPIPAFCGGSQGAADVCADADAPLNWALAQVQWDTSTLNPVPSAATDWKFWVVTWMENGGNLVGEIAQHGLASIPAAGIGSIAEVPVETYSNNVGFYNQVFTLELPTSGTTTAGATRTSDAHLALDAVELPPSGVLRDHAATVRVQHRASGRDFDYVRTLLYERDPVKGWKLIDMDIIPHVAAGASFVVPFQYHPRTCGPRTLFVQALPSDGGEFIEDTFDVFVTLDPKVRSRLLAENIVSLGLDRGTMSSLLAKLQAAERSFAGGNRSAGLGALHAFAHAVAAQSGKKIPLADATRLTGLVDDLDRCI